MQTRAEIKQYKKVQPNKPQKKRKVNKKLF
jgi:hypothetical protein